MKINWKQKLTSRKFWMAVIGFVTPLLISFGLAESTATEIASIIMSGGSCIAYIMGEGLVDAERNTNYGMGSDNTENTADKKGETK